MSEGGAAIEMTLPDAAPACPDDTVLSGSPPGGAPADEALRGYAAQVAAEDAKIQGLLDELHEREMRRSVLLLEMERLQHREGEAEADRGGKRAAERRRHAGPSAAPSALDATFLDLGPEEADTYRDDKGWPSMVQAASPGPSAAAENPMGHFLDVSSMGLECREECADFLGAAPVQGVRRAHAAGAHGNRVSLARVPRAEHRADPQAPPRRRRAAAGAAQALAGARPLQSMAPAVASPPRQTFARTAPTGGMPAGGAPAESRARGEGARGGGGRREELRLAQDACGACTRGPRARGEGARAEVVVQAGAAGRAGCGRRLATVHLLQVPTDGERNDECALTIGLNSWLITCSQPELPTSRPGAGDDCEHGAPRCLDEDLRLLPALAEAQCQPWSGRGIRRAWTQPRHDLQPRQKVARAAGVAIAPIDPANLKRWGEAGTLVPLVT
eukprot:CAMPEP_0179377692 /NCGR_PEP_ID=MMETSP0797-20121207/88956_1 /TAXON_ID=47934 /ORGANISM="Dinophysis acuminata, Strain DAEP01" /LENGTH=444 /DNA_ID=CAMNT_0021093751 /DNA_START=71 /DNA_END=1400 /DNA_ORIENTATION=-